MSEINYFTVRCGFCCECSRFELGTLWKTFQSDLRRNVRVATRGLSVINSIQFLFIDLILMIEIVLFYTLSLTIHYVVILYLEFYIM